MKGAAAPLLLLLAGCEFDDGALTELKVCQSQVDCASPLAPFCLAGRCVPGSEIAGGEGEGEGERSGIGEIAGEGEEALNVPPHDCDAEGGGPEDCPGAGEGAPPADPPIAVAKAPASASLGDVVEVDGSESVGRGLELTWTVTGPDGEAAEVTTQDDSNATFVATRAGTWRVRLTIVDDARRTDTGQDQEVEILGFEALERRVDAADIGSSDDGESVWIATVDGGSRAVLLPAPEDDPNADRLWQWTDYDGAGQGTDAVSVGPRSAWLARTVSGTLRVRRTHGDDDLRPATPQALPGVGRVNASVVGPARRVWFGGEDGLGRTLGNEGGSLGPPLDLPGERRVIALHAAPSGLWVGRPTGICHVAWTEESQLTCDRKHTLVQDVDHLLTALAEDGIGALWVATDRQGLYRITPDGQIDVIAPGNRGVPEGRLDDLASDPGGDVWGVGAGVLFRIYPGGDTRIEVFDAASGLVVLGAIQSVNTAAEGDVWVSGALGIARLNR